MLVEFVEPTTLPIVLPAFGSLPYRTATVELKDSLIVLTEPSHINYPSYPIYPLVVAVFHRTRQDETFVELFHVNDQQREVRSLVEVYSLSNELCATITRPCMQSKRLAVHARICAKRDISLK